MNIMSRFDFKKVIVPILLFILLFISFNIFINIFSNGDMRTHASFARQMLTGERPTAGNFLFYWLVNTFSFFSVNVTPSQVSLCFLLAIATTFKYHLSQRTISKIVDHNQQLNQRYWFSVLLALSLLVIMAIPIPSFFVSHSFVRGNFVPNNWYNSTVIFLFPFALLLFRLSYKQLISYDLNRNWWIGFLIFLNIFLKPSYFFVFISVYPLLLLVKYKLNKEFWFSLLPVFIGVVLLSIEYYTIYQSATGVKDPSSVVFKPLYSYTLESELWQLPVSLVFSTLFPLLYSLFNISKIKNSLLFWFCFLSLVVSIFIYLVLAESGPRAIHGNFYWQVIICNWFCFFVTLLALIKDFNSEGKTIRNRFLMSIYLLHVLVGVIYFGRLFIKG